MDVACGWQDMVQPMFLFSVPRTVSAERSFSRYENAWMEEVDSWVCMSVCCVQWWS